MTETAGSAAPKVPTVYFIDDSATMREVIKIAFRREAMRVIACNDAASALAQFDENAPDAVITDVIMPGKDGYEVCQLIKKDEKLGKTPVILMSGVVDRTVAEKAIAARADELIRKPFQPQELIARVKNLLNPKPQKPAVPDNAAPAPPANYPAADLSGIFALPERVAPSSVMTAPAREQAVARPAMRANGGAAAGADNSSASSAEIQKLRLEIQRIEMLVRKLQAELEAERQYVASLESHVRALHEAK